MNRPAPGRAALGNSELNTTRSMRRTALQPSRPPSRLRPGRRRRRDSAPRWPPSCARFRRTGGRCFFMLSQPCSYFSSAHHLAGEIARVAGVEQHAGLAILDQFLVAADVGRHHQPPLRHRFQRLQRGDQFGQPHRVARVDQHVDQVVIAVHFVVRHAPGEDHAVLQVERHHLLLQRGILRPAADQQQLARRASV